MPNIGYGSAKSTKHMLPNGFKKVVVNNLKVRIGIEFFCWHVERCWDGYVSWMYLGNCTFIVSRIVKTKCLCTGTGGPHDAEQEILCWNCSQCFFQEAKADCGKGETVGHQSDQWQCSYALRRERVNGKVEWSSINTPFFCWNSWFFIAKIFEKHSIGFKMGHSEKELEDKSTQLVQ